MRLFFVSVFFLSVLVGNVLAGNAMAADTAQTTGEKYLENFLANTQTLEAGFQQTLRAHDGEVLQETSGRFYLSRPGRFRWDYVEPYAQQIVSDGERIWIYDIDLEQVTVQRQSQGLSTTPMALLQNSATLHQQFRVVPLDNRDGIYRLKLLSKSPDSDFGEIVVGLDKHGLRFLQLHDQFEQVTDIVFADTTTNGERARERFEFIPPDRVDVFGV